MRFRLGQLLESPNPLSLTRVAGSLLTQTCSLRAHSSIAQHPSTIKPDFGSLTKSYLMRYDDKRFHGQVTVMPVEEFKQKVLAANGRARLQQSH